MAADDPEKAERNRQLNIVIMGGSFNPPTIAHLKIMQMALDLVNARIGFLVPVSFPYLKRKMVKAGQSHLCLPDDLRIRMLKAMTASDSRIQIFTDVMDNPFSDDVKIGRLLQERYPGAGIYYVFGADKLDLLENFARRSDFFDRFRCILYARESGCFREEIAAHELLSAYMESLILTDPPDGIEDVSSTRIREHLFDAEAAADMLHPDVIPLLCELTPDDFPEEILRFRDEYAFLSNDYPAEVSYKGIAYPCAESAFLSSKCENPAEKKEIAGMKPDNARKKYSAKAGSAEWGEARTDIMEEIVRLKFRQHQELMDLLTATENRKLINGGKEDDFWGVNLTTWEGENYLGRILMEIRAEWRKQ